MNAWRPIATAPKDRRILVYEEGLVHVVEWFDREWRGDGKWFTGYWCADDGNWYVDYPTHWMECPEAPKD